MPQRKFSVAELHSPHGKFCMWIERKSKLIGRHSHHALCNHGGEICVVINKNEILVDGFHSETSTVYQFYGCKWHGCRCLGTVFDRAEGRHHQAMATENQIQSLGYNVVLV